jgi:hypothetical protein
MVEGTLTALMKSALKQNARFSRFSLIRTKFILGRSFERCALIQIPEHDVNRLQAQ